ncbi:MAG: Imm10 family immunity protein [Propionibacteriaceae bacterium]|nr:Imm10 family immunity protein [Propionibacteriaceae bacterium]
MNVGWLEDRELLFWALVIEDPESGDTIEIQREITVDGERVTPVPGSLCLVRGGAATFYEGLQDWAVEGTRLTLTLSEDAAEALGLPTDVEIDLDADGAALAKTHLPQLTS